MAEREIERQDGGDLQLGISGSEDSIVTGRVTADRETESDPGGPPAEEVEFARQMELGRISMRKHRDVLAALAK